jgi:hypothetical protein
MNKYEQLRALVRHYFATRMLFCHNCDGGDNSAPCECVEIENTLDRARQKLKDEVA